MQKMYCANPECVKHTVHSGGEFIYSPTRRAFFCKDCAAIPFQVMNGAKNLWEFSTTHFTGERVQVRNLQHLRSLEKQYGVSNQAANNDQAHWNVPPSHSAPPPVMADPRVSVGRGRPEARR